jgi:hypothetical protein
MPPARPAKSPSVQPASYQVASADTRPAPAPAAQPAFELASTTSKPVILAGDDVSAAIPRLSRPAQAASLVGRSNVSANDVINERGYWQGPNGEAPEAASANTPVANAPRPGPTAAPAPRRAPAASTSAEPVSTASVTASATPWPLADRGNNEPIPNALAYAAQPTPIAAARTLPMGTGAGTGPGTGTARAAQGEIKRSEERFSAAPPVSAATSTKVKGTTVVRVGDRFNDPWMRAMIVSPSAQSFMRTTVYGVQDFRTLSPYLLKPATAVATTFTDDPHLGMSTEKFAGTAVAFTPTITFGLPRTAAAQR